MSFVGKGLVAVLFVASSVFLSDAQGLTDEQEPATAQGIADFIQAKAYVNCDGTLIGGPYQQVGAACAHIHLDGTPDEMMAENCSEIVQMRNTGGPINFRAVPSEYPISPAEQANQITWKGMVVAYYNIARRRQIADGLARQWGDWEDVPAQDVVVILIQKAGHWRINDLRSGNPLSLDNPLVPAPAKAWNRAVTDQEGKLLKAMYLPTVSFKEFADGLATYIRSCGWITAVRIDPNPKPKAKFIAPIIPAYGAKVCYHFQIDHVDSSHTRRTCIEPSGEVLRSRSELAEPSSYWKQCSKNDGVVEIKLKNPQNDARRSRFLVCGEIELLR